MWIVGIYLEYYPEIYEFDTREKAQAFYDKRKARDTFNGEYLGDKIYLAEVKESIGSR